MEDRKKALFIPNYKGQTLKTYLIEQISGGVHQMTWDMTQFITFLLVKFNDTNVIIDWEKEFLLYIEEEAYEQEQMYNYNDTE